MVSSRAVLPCKNKHLVCPDRLTCTGRPDRGVTVGESWCMLWDQDYSQNGKIIYGCERNENS